MPKTIIEHFLSNLNRDQLSCSPPPPPPKKKLTSCTLVLGDAKLERSVAYICINMALTYILGVTG
jgi:hypothetical protein